MDPNSPNPSPAPAAPPADNTPPAPAPAEPVAPVVDPAPTPAPNTIDPVDHSQPTPPVVDPAAPPADPAPGDATPPADDPNAEPDAGDLIADQEPDELEASIKAKQENGGELPSGVNPDGTVDPLVYAYEAIPEITVQGKEGTKGEIKEYTVRTADDLPDDFRFANAKEQAKFNGALAQNMQLAQQAINEANEHNATRIAQNERRTLLVTQKTELDSLIESGKMPAITAKPGDANFMQDPGAVRAQAVLDHMNTINADYAARGINQKITSVEVALQLLEAKEAIEARDARMGKVTDTRNDISGKINGSGTSTPPASPTGGQRVYRNAAEAARAGLKRLGQ